MNLHKYPHLKLGLVLGGGTILSLVLCVQCVRTYLYTDAVLVPQQAERVAERQVGQLTAAARSAGLSDARSLGPVIEHSLDSASDRILWMRVLDQENNVLAQVGNPQGTAKVPPKWWERMEKHETLGNIVETPEGKAFVAILPLRMPRPMRPPDAEIRKIDRPRGAIGRRGTAYFLELAIPLKAVASAFDGLRQNLIVGLIASIALLTSLAAIALRARRYLRGRYLESELQLARRVQSDLQPKPHTASPYVDFAAASVAADHVGGDFYDVFETATGEIAIVLGDVSGKGIPAALLVSVLQGAIRSSTTSEHESACERVNRMLCERTAGARFATLFWGVFDPATGVLRYVNAGHAAPMLFRRGHVERLDEGGPVLGLLPMACYSAATVRIDSSDTLVLYSDGISEAADEKDEEFGEERIELTMRKALAGRPSEVAEQLMQQATAFSRAGTAPDDRTLMVVRFPQPASSQRRGKYSPMAVEAVA